jgi:hypothetical protein
MGWKDMELSRGAVCVEGLRKTTKNLRIGCLQAEIKT